MLPITSGLPCPRGPMFEPVTANRPNFGEDASSATGMQRQRPAYLESRFEQDLLQDRRTWGGNTFAPFTDPVGQAKLPLEHDILHHEGSEMRLEANPAALGTLSSTLTAAPMLGAAVAATTAFLNKS